MHGQAPPAKHPLGLEDEAEWMAACEGARNHLEAQLGWLHGHVLRLGALPDGPSSAQQDELVAMTAAIERMLGLLESTLWPSAGRPSPRLKLETVDPASLLAELARQTQIIAAGGTSPGQVHQNLRIVADTPHDLPTIMADVLQLRRVLENLLLNSLLHASADTIRLSADRDGPDHLVIHLDDTGLGMSERGGSPGLGLSICERLVRAHGGSIQAHSEQGVGTRLTVRLPIEGQPASNRTDQTDPSPTISRPTWIDRAHAIAEAGHDLRCPLNAVIGFARLMREQLDSPADTQRRTTLEQIDKRARSLLQLTNQLLEAARLATNRLRLAESRVRGTDLLERAASALKAAGEPPLRVDIDVQPADSVITGDDERLCDALVFLAADGLADLEAGSVALSVRSASTPPEHQGESGKMTTARIEIAAHGPQKPACGSTTSSTTKPTEPGDLERRLGVLLARGYVRCHGGHLEYTTGPDHRVWVVTLCGQTNGGQRT